MRILLTGLSTLLLCACAGPKYTVDDGRKVNEVLLANIRAYGAGERALRPAIARSSGLKDAQCETQWELPFSVETSYGQSSDDRVAWVRALNVDERLTVVATAPGSPLKLGDKLAEVGGYGAEDTQRMMLELADLRDSGKPFGVKLFSGQNVAVHPFKICRGYSRLAPPATPQAQDYHWLMNVHPLQVAKGELTEDEALWLVLWGQGVSEEGGARMKTYAYGSKIVGTLFSLFSIASGIQSATAAANAAVQAAQSAASAAATEVLKQQLIDQATAAATNKLREEATGIVKKLTQSQVMNAMQQAAANRGSLSGVAWVASTVFDDADAWAFARIEKLKGDPMAVFTLHQKLIENGLFSNAMVLDPQRMAAITKLVDARGLHDNMVAALQGIKPEELQAEMQDMPLASAPGSFSYEDANDPSARAQPFARGLVDGMLNMPMETGRAR